MLDSADGSADTSGQAGSEAAEGGACRQGHVLGSVNVLEERGEAVATNCHLLLANGAGLVDVRLRQRRGGIDQVHAVDGNVERVVGPVVGVQAGEAVTKVGAA